LKREQELESQKKKNSKIHFHRLNLPGETFHSFGTINKKKPKPQEDSDDDLAIHVQPSQIEV